MASENDRAGAAQTTDAASPRDARRLRLALIAVHGVANQQPNESNSAVASLLANAPDGEATRRYSTFARRELQISLDPVELPPSATRVEPTQVAAPVTSDATTATPEDPPKRPSRRVYLDRARPAPTDSTGPDDSDWALGYEFMAMQLEHYAPDPRQRVYDTTVLEGTRTTPRSDGTTDVRTVHVFELYWADLSRLASGPLAFFGSLYQIVLHLATLGRQAMDDAAHEKPTAIWRLLGFCQLTAVRLLTLPVPMLNVVLVVTGVGLILADFAIGSAWSRVLVVSLAIAPLIGFPLFKYGRARVASRPAEWALLPTAVALISVGGAYLLVASEVVSRTLTVCLAWWLLGFAITVWVASAYEQMRRYATPIAAAAYVLAAATFFYFLATGESAHAHPRGSMEYAALYTTQVIFAALRLLWVVLYGMALLLVVLWPLAWLTTRGDTAVWARGRAALRTGRLSLCLSAGAFLTVTIIAWSGVFSYGVAKFETFAATEPKLFHVPESLSGLQRWLVPDPATLRVLDSLTAETAADRSTFTTPEYIEGMIAESVGGAAPISIALTSLAFVLLVWMALPSVFAERNAPSSCKNRESRAMGWWLSRGLDSTRWVTHLVFAAVFVVPVIVIRVLPRDGALMQSTYEMVGSIGAFVAAFAVVILGVVANFGGIALDVVLDVDNYLRSTPATSTPRARICERYVSLLRHIAEPDEYGRARYDGVIIVAHSLGALITAELLHFLVTVRRRGIGDPRLAALGYGREVSGGTDRIPLVMYTMGNPLRQLLNRFFPHRYRWVRSIPDNGSKSLQPGDEPSPRADEPNRPDPAALGVVHWESAYRSGDYVGRSIWLEEWYNRNDHGPDGGAFPDELLLWKRDRVGAGIVEYCIGCGGHTHYWDRTAPDVRARLDDLIGAGWARE